MLKPSFYVGVQREDVVKLAHSCYKFNTQVGSYDTCYREVILTYTLQRLTSTTTDHHFQQQV